MATWDNREKPGTSEVYDEPGLTYDGLIDPESGLVVLYDGLGSVPTYTNIIKH